MSYELVLPDGRRFALHKEWIRIGRADDNDLVISNSTVSRYHINIYVKPDAVVAENAGSQTGFFVNNESVNEAKALSPGDVIYLGNAYLSFVRAGESPIKQKKSQESENKSGPSLYAMASKAAVKGVSNSSANTTRVIMYGALAAFVIFMAMSEDKSKKPAAPAKGSPDAPLAFGLQPLPADAYLKNNQALKSEDEVRAEGKFQEGLQDYYNQNYGRARLSFQESAEFNPNHEKSLEYLAKTDAKMLELINDAIRDSEQSYGLGQLRRARWQAARALSVISQQIPGYARKLAQEADIESIKRNLAQGQEETLLTIPCEQSMHKDKCNSALTILKETRRALGDEDLIKRYEQ